MLELDITDFFQTEEPYNFSASCFEMGDNAGTITWNNAKKEAENYLYWLDTKAYNGTECRDVLRYWFGQFGAWEKDEIAGWNDQELIALLIQFISGDIRDAGLDNDHWSEIDWEASEQGQQEGTYSGNIFYVPETQKVYYSIG